jgi:sulfite exporter TauE/SafE
MLTTAFILGLAGSLHCAGMCSPLAFAVTNMSKSVWLSRSVYNAGRIFTYGILGAIVSTIGVALPLEKFQFGLSVGMGVVLIVVAFLGIGKIRSKTINGFVGRFAGWIKTRFSNQIQSKTTASTFLLGALNGLLPCGLSFMALTACLIVPTTLDGFYFMLVFGAGTLPVMLGFMSIAQLLVNRFRLSYARVNTIMLIVAGSILIARAYWPHNHDGMAHTSNEVVVCEE